ncbi:MAG: glycosyltransferase family 2 protein [Lachnospiraceae bacterium]|nr:glycosyltransferase family 2 protein [Lachnospiraceae bacterium]
MSLYSVVVPVYNSQATLVELHQRLCKVFDEKLSLDFELVLVDDSSRDGSFSKMQQLRQQDKRVKIVQLSRNYGQHCALLCGFKYAKGDYIITMDDDLQHPPEEIPKLIQVLNGDPEIDVVIGRYESKKHGPIRNFGTYLANRVSSAIFKKDPKLQLTSFRIMKRFVVEAMLEMHVDFPRIGHLLLMVSNRICNVVVEHDSRKYGKSGYTFKRLVKDFFANILTNSSFPLIVVRDIGIASFIISILLGIYYLYRYLLYGISIQGWITLVLLILSYSGLILLAIGIIGDYLIRILKEAKKIPNYAIRQCEMEDEE